MLAIRSIAAWFGLTQPANVILLVLNLAGASLYLWLLSSFGAWTTPNVAPTSEFLMWGMIVIRHSLSHFS